MNPFDAGVVSFLNSFARRSWAFDTFVSGVLDDDFIKSGIIVALLWWVWFQTGEREGEQREFVLFGIVSSLMAVGVARILALTLPFRERPLHNPALHFRVPYGVDENVLLNWSSFPSDHAALLFALVTTLFCASRRVGLLAFAHVFFVVGLTRVYLGYHYPTDILVGAVLGIAIASLSRITVLRKTVAQPGVRWAHGHPPSFYASLFLVTLLISDIFDPLRHLVRFAVKMMRL